YPVIKSNIINYYDNKGNIISNRLGLDHYFTNSNTQVFSALNEKMIGCNKNSFKLYYSSYTN
ncbi:MAG: hypothetical protein ACRCV0_01570, partial [Brevinema sp.]